MEINTQFGMHEYYNGKFEKLYPSDHPEVLKWVDFFRDRFRAKKIFESFLQKTNSSNLENKAKLVANSWHQFSELMPWFLCQACASLSNNKKRHFAIQTAFEELGMRNAEKIHHEMFWSAVESAIPGIDQEVYPTISTTLDYLRDKLLNSSSDSHILGMLMGLEGPAEENIELIFSSIAHNKLAEKKLDKHEFFVVHRQIEIEHVKLTVSNFLRFCPSDSEKEDFLVGFDDGIHFWELFWGGVERLVSEKQS